MGTVPTVPLASATRGGEMLDLSVLIVEKDAVGKQTPPSHC